MNSALIYIILTIAAATLIPLAFAFYRDWDYKRQITGKKKTRTLKEGKNIRIDEGERNVQADLLKFEAEMRMKDNLLHSRHIR